MRSFPIRPLMLVCALCVAFGVGLRVQQLGFPPWLSFDEHHFVVNARNFLAGTPDMNDHPPLGKLLMASAMHFLGDTPVAWRLAALLFGLANIALAGVLARVLYCDAVAAALAATFFAIDGFLIAYSRTALLDGVLLSCGLAAVLLLATPTPPRIVLAGAVMGLAASIKLSGITLGLPLALAVLVLDLRFVRKLPLLAASGLAALLAFYAQYALGQRLTGLSASPAGVAQATMALVRHHAALTQMTNPFTSHWYAWFIPSKPIMLRYDVIDGVWVRAMTMLGNPLLWWSSAAVVAGTLGSTLLQGGRDLLGAGRASHEAITSFLRSRWSSILPLAGFLGFLAPWVLTSRDSYIYHYLPSYGFGLVLLAGTAARAGLRFPLALLVAVLLVAEVSVFYAPVWAQLPLSADSLALRLFLPAWR